MPWPRWRPAGRSCTACRSQVTTTGTPRPMPPEAEVVAAADRPGGAGQRGQARPRQPGRADPVATWSDEVALDVRDDGRASTRPALPGAGRPPRPRSAAGPARPAPAAGEPGSAAGSAWSRCGSGSRGCRRHAAGASRSRAPARRSRPASAPGAGMSASTSLPVPPRRAPRDAGGSPAGRSRLLIVDDHPVVRDGLSGMFAPRARLRGGRRGRRRRRGGPAGPGARSPT